MTAPDFLNYAIGGGQLAALLAIIFRLGKLCALVEQHERRISRLERAKA